MTAFAAAPPQPDDTSSPAAVRTSSWYPWLGPILVTLIGGWLRFANLGRPEAVVFDETYYAKDALSLLKFGYEQGAVEDADDLLLAGDGNIAELEIFTGEPSFIVHPPVGKWVIAAGEALFGATPFGWRFGVALLGTLTVLLLARVVWNLTGSPAWGSVAGLLLAIDGMAIALSRTAVLDGILAFFVLAGFTAIVADRRWIRKRGSPNLGWAWWRPWRLVAAASLGLACGVKWSGIWFFAAFAILTVLWEVARRRRLDDDWVLAFIKDAIPAAITMLAVGIVVYVASWYGWFASDGAWARDWAGDGGAWNALRSLWHYHDEMLGFHTGLNSEHSYQSPAWGWLVQARPTSFFYESGASGCGSGDCAQEVIALGNPVIWWAAILAMLHQGWRWFAARDWRSGAVLLGVAAGWVPWLFYSERTIFAFYSVVFLPFMIAALSLTLATIANPVGNITHRPGPTSRNWRLGLVTAFLLVCVGVSWFFYPIWSAEIIETAAWSNRMWLPTWI
ncbi:MAG: phospholipid carrier-dependent glycosyltransferase [Actinomycetia bacterium]|nr:phospholipid carrier-dependent glycosyltransferase [Actinomycetes bacterium]